MRSCFEGDWHLFGDNLAALSHGRYYFAPVGTPHFPGKHNLWSREWLDRNWRNIVSLGQDLDAPTRWYNGSAPAVLPRATVAGSLDCIANGERYALRLIRGMSGLDNGFPRACFTQADIRDAWILISSIDRCPTQKLFAWVIQRMYADDSAAIAAVYADWLGPGLDVRFVNATATLPAISAIVNANYTVCVLDGTRNFQTWACHAFDALGSPTNIGIFGTAQFWYDSSTYVIDQLEAMPITVDAPILLVGHSYGAIVAALVAARLRHARPSQTIALLTYGMPKPGDARLIALLDRVRSFHLANNHDTITLLPPELPQLLTLVPYFGPAILNLWTGWQRPTEVNTQNADGELFLRPADEPDTSQLLFLVSQAISHQSLDARFGHQIEEYLRRLERRCPFVQWPIPVPVNEEIQGILGWKLDGGTRPTNAAAAVALDGGDGQELGAAAAVALGGAGELGTFTGSAAAIALDGEGEIGPPDPGADCDGAPELAFDTDYTYSIASGFPPTNHWFYAPITGGNVYHVTVTINSGSIGSASTSDGICAASTLKFTRMTTGCDSATFSSGPKLIIQVTGPLMGSGNYTIRVGTGACP